MKGLVIAGNVAGVPAPFICDLLGYRVNKDTGKITKNPNTSDAGDGLSIRLGTAFFDLLGIPRDKPAPLGPGADVEQQMVDFLQPLRPDLVIAKSSSVKQFSQYAHLDVFPKFKDAFSDLRPALNDLTARILKADLGASRGRIEEDLTALYASTDAQSVLFEELVVQMPEESFLNVDVSVGIPHAGQEHPELAIAISSKWTLRTDRAQDCFSQGNKLMAQRRGKMPHFGVITIETRPSMLKILADGSAVDYIYHLDLPTLTATLNKVAESARGRWSPLETYGRIMRQERLRDFDKLVYEVMRVPGPDGAPSPIEEAGV